MNNLKIYNFIESYGARCIKLNFALISNFRLNKISDLQDTSNNYFLLPLRAGKLKIISHLGNFALENKDIEYHIHGTGITFTLDEIKYSFEYFPQVNNNNIPIFSISSIYDYIETIYENIEQDVFMKIMNKLVDDKRIIKIYEHGFSFYIPELEVTQIINYQGI